MNHASRSILPALFAAALVGSLASCRKDNPVEAYNYDKAVTVDSVTVRPARATDGSDLAAIQLYLYIDNNADSTGTSEWHVIESLFVTARAGGEDAERVLATGASAYQGMNNERITIGETDSVLVAETDALRGDGYDQNLRLVFTGARYLADDTEFVVFGYDQDRTPTGPLFINKRGETSSVSFYTPGYQAKGIY